MKKNYPSSALYWLAEHHWVLHSESGSAAGCFSLCFLVRRKLHGYILFIEIRLFICGVPNALTDRQITTPSLFSKSVPGYTDFLPFHPSVPLCSFCIHLSRPHLSPHASQTMACLLTVLIQMSKVDCMSESGDQIPKQPGGTFDPRNASTLAVCCSTSLKSYGAYTVKYWNAKNIAAADKVLAACSPLYSPFLMFQSHLWEGGLPLC